MSLNICRDRRPRLSAPFVVTFSTDRMVSVGDCFLREDDILPYGSLFTSFPSARVILEWSRPTGFFALLKNDSVGRRSEGSRADCFRLAVVFNSFHRKRSPSLKREAIVKWFAFDFDRRIAFDGRLFLAGG